MGPQTLTVDERLTTEGHTDQAKGNARRTRPRPRASGGNDIGARQVAGADSRTHV